jgi:sugar (pentulose or hexulose) kinase
MLKTGYLGIDVGTQGLSVLLVDEDLGVLCDGVGHYDMVPGLGPNHYEQDPNDWERALVEAMADLRKNLKMKNMMLDGGVTEEEELDCIVSVAGIGIAGQMHGEVIVNERYELVGAARLWCDGRNELESSELTEALAVKCPKRLTACRWLYTVRTKPLDYVSSARFITTPAGWISYKLTGEWSLGIGDASGMFPIDPDGLGYYESKLDIFDVMLAGAWCNRIGGSNPGTPLPKFKSYLPSIKVAGGFNKLNPSGASILGLRADIIVAPAEGDQPAALAGSLIGQAGQVSMSFGTSVVCNSVCDRVFETPSRNVDHFCAVDGRPINMVWLRNGTTPMNLLINMFGTLLSNINDPFSILMPMVASSPDDCDGVIALPFTDDEPNMGILTGGSCGVFGLNKHNCTPGNVAKAMLLSTFFNLRIGCDIVRSKGFSIDEIILTGGVTRSPALGQLVADVFNAPVIVMEAAQEGCAWGASVLASYSVKCSTRQETAAWAEFLKNVSARRDDRALVRFLPREASVNILSKSFGKHLNLLELHGNLARISNS